MDDAHLRCACGTPGLKIAGTCVKFLIRFFDEVTEWNCNHVPQEWTGS